MNLPIEVREVAADDTLPLRTQVLRPSHAPDARLFGVEDEEETRHFAVVEGEEIVGACYIVRRAAPFNSEPTAWMLRGMAVEPSRQGQGIGALLVRRVEEEALRADIELLWFNARIKAVGFYEKLGFTIIGDEFDIPTVGPHLRMWKWIIQPRDEHR